MGYSSVPDISAMSIVDQNNVWSVSNNGRIFKMIPGTITDVKEMHIALPQIIYLYQNYPNPFNPTTTIKYSIPVETRHASSLQHITLKVYDILGKEVATLVNEEKAPGNYEVKFDGANLSSGVYFYRLQSGSFTQTKKFVLMK
ncbi:MAG: T9SS type A sorting domain-containing protein [Melioribacteraceae bacterium]